MPGKLLVKCLLARALPDRLGFDLDYGAVKRQAWFNGIDFDAIERRAVPAPWLPTDPDP